MMKCVNVHIDNAFVGSRENFIKVETNHELEYVH